MHPSEPIHITVVGDPSDPRSPREYPEGVIVHHVPEWHPDDIDVVNGLPTTSLARTLVDLAECETRASLRASFARARELGILDLAAVRASAARVEWRPSLAMLHQVVAEFEQQEISRDGRSKRGRRR
jgi:hypothetical protein